MRRPRKYLYGICTLVAITALGADVRAQEDGAAALELKGFAINITGIGAGRSGDFEVRIDRWSTPDERAALRRALEAADVPGLARALASAAPVGRVHTLRGGDTPVLYAGEASLDDGGRRIVLAMAGVDTASEGGDPGFLAVEIRLAADGSGEGRVATPDQLSFDPDAGGLQVERYATRPVWLKEIEVVSPRD